MNLEDQISQITNPQEFTRLCNSILTEKHQHKYQVIDGTRSDEGNDGYVVSEKRIFAMYCPIKPERKNDSDYVGKIRSDLKKALVLKESGKYEIENWTFLTPRKLSNRVIVLMRQEAESIGIEAIHQEATFLANELLKHKHLISDFPFLHNYEIESKIDEILELVKASTADKKQAEEEIDENHLYKGETKNKEELEKVFKLRGSPQNKSIKLRLKTLYYKSSDHTVKVNSLLGILDLYDPVEDAAEDVIQLCDEGIVIADSLKANTIKAHFLAQKAYLLSSIYVNLDFQASVQIMTDNAIGIIMVADEYKQEVQARLEELEKSYTDAFSEALSLSKSNKDYYALASVLIFIGNAAGQRALYLQALNVNERAAKEKSTCRVALLSAKDIYSHYKEELSEANALFNLANQIRFFGEKEEALQLAEDASEIANKYDDQVLIKKTGWLISTLETGEIPNYLGGERRE